jgi:eukaryotic-like serine/threonine-protein kinase
MTFSVGTRLGLYEITGPLGSGGMGEVYQATDTKLGRSVAIKVLPDAFAQDVDRALRFEREARVLASLNHPHIATIHGLEESGDRKFLVMELVLGETLAEWISRGPIPLDDALKIARQIAEALEAAHEKGIVHRDLKPANIKIGPNGQVKVLDFGLAKAFESEVANPNLSHSPTLSLAGTNAGIILGTAAYMSPEQARGMTVDRRTDIFAFGAVLYEMLTGRPAFQGDTVSDILASVLKVDPDWNRFPKETPASIRRLLRRCLQKDRNHRLDSAAAARIEIEEAGFDPEIKEQLSSPIQPETRRLPWILVAALFVVALSLGIPALRHVRETIPAQQDFHFDIVLPGNAPPELPAIAPDGRQLAFITTSGTHQIWIHNMDALDSRPVPGTEGATYPFWSPDGTHIGFFAQGKLKKIAIAGGPAQTLCDATDGRGASWNRDDVIIFSQGPGSAILRVPSAGGVPTAVTMGAGGDLASGHRFPSFLPDGVHFFYNAGSDKPDAAGIYIGSLDGSSPIRILPDPSNALYAPPANPGNPGYFLFKREESLMAQPFDSKTLKMAGEMFPVSERVPYSVNTGFGAFSVSENGILIYRTGGRASTQLAWMDRAGKHLSTVGKPGPISALSLSPDEKTVALELFTGSQRDVWLQDIGRDVLVRFTFMPGLNGRPVWSPDGARLIFSFQATGIYSSDILQRFAAGNAAEELLLHAGINAYPEDWSSDGKWIAYQQDNSRTATDLWLLPASQGTETDKKPVPYLQTAFDESNPRFSPDGKWIAYQSNESGRNEVYVQGIPAGGRKWQISSSGGAAPRWRQDGAELFYVSAEQKLMAAPIKIISTVEPGTPEPLFTFPAPSNLVLLGFAYAPSRDGQRFLVNAPAGGENAAAPPLTVVTNWQAALKK